MEQLFLVFTGYLLVINLIGFFLCGWDKRAAQKDRWRTPEKHFFLTALIGGALGVLLGMKVFRHKTKHWYFVVGIPLILVLQLAVCGLYIWKF